MVKKSIFVGITLPLELVLTIEQKRGDLPRSYVYKKLIESGFQNNILPITGVD